MTKLFLLAAFILMGSVSPVMATAEKKPSIDEVVELMGRAAHDALPNAKIGKDELIGEERAKKLTYPLIPHDVMKLVVGRGYIAGIAAHCGLDWQKDAYEPTMAVLRKRFNNYTDYQFAFIGILHGISMGQAEASQKDKPCDDATKKKISDIMGKGKGQ